MSVFLPRNNKWNMCYYSCLFGRISTHSVRAEVWLTWFDDLILLRHVTPGAAGCTETTNGFYFIFFPTFQVFRLYQQTEDGCEVVLHLLAVPFLVPNPSVSCVKPQLTRRGLNLHIWSFKCSHLLCHYFWRKSCSITHLNRLWGQRGSNCWTFRLWLFCLSVCFNLVIVSCQTGSCLRAQQHF